MYLNVYVPGRQREQGVVNFFRFDRGNQFVSSVLMDPISKDFVAALENYARREKVPVIQFLQWLTQRRHRSGAAEAVQEGRGRRFHRQGAGEDACVPYRAPTQPSVSLTRIVPAPPEQATSP